MSESDDDDIDEGIELINDEEEKLIDDFDVELIHGEESDDAETFFQASRGGKLKLLRRELPKLLKESAPVSLTNFVFFGSDMILLAYIGRIPCKAAPSSSTSAASRPASTPAPAVDCVADYQASYSIGDFLVQFTRGFISGTMGAFDTIISQLHGAKKRRELTIMIQTGLLVVMGFSIPIAISWIYTSPILNALGQDPHLTLLSQQFVRSLLPQLPFFVFLSGLRRSLYAMGFNKLPLLIGCISLLLSSIIGYCIIFAPGKLGFEGAPWSQNIYFISFSSCLILSFLLMRSVRANLSGGFALRAALRWQRVKQFILLGLPAAAMFASEILAYCASELISGKLGAVAMSAHMICFTWLFIVYFIPMGLMIVSTARMGQALGEGRWRLAFNIGTINGILTALVALIQIIVTISAREGIAAMFTADEETRQLAVSVLPVASAASLFDGLQSALQSFIRSSGKQKLGAVAFFVGFGLIGLPLGATLCLATPLGLTGLWIGTTSGSFTTFLLMLFFVYRFDWEEIQREAVKRTKSIDINDDDEDEGGDEME